jgi:hypothetical protein
MLDRITHWIAGSPARLVRSGFAGFVAGTCALLLAALAQVADGLPAWAVPDSSLAFTAAALLVCWGVWAMGSGLKLARERAAPARNRR